MAGDRTLGILGEIQALVLDKLQVVSYKWLSRNFLVSSNDSKRLLQEFIDKHGSGLEVVYALSGWLKNNPDTYHIRLVSGLKLSEVKLEFEDNYSIQVYSVQPCIPKDPAVLWSSEFVQAEELFDEPSTNDNCLRDNRFCGVSNSLVKRIIVEKTIGIPSAQPECGLGALASSKTSGFQQNTSVRLPQPGQVQQLSTKIGPESSTVVLKEDRSESSEVRDQYGKPHLDKDKITAIQVSKKKNQNEKNPSGNGGSLASLWSHASAKAKPLNLSVDSTMDIPGDAFTEEAHPPKISVTEEAHPPKISVTEEAQTCAREALDTVGSDDDGQNINCKRESTGGSGRKRRVVFDFSDDEDEEEPVVSLASPEPPSGKPRPESAQSAENLVVKEKNMNLEGRNNLEIKQDKTTESNSGSAVKGDVGGARISKTVGSSLSEKTQNHVPDGLLDKSKNENATTSVPTSPKRRKVLKTRIDDRGREVTEVSWEGEVAECTNTEKKDINNGAGNRPPTANKAAPSGNIAPSNQASKVGSRKTSKGGAKDAKQGNILTFFKKI